MRHILVVEDAPEYQAVIKRALGAFQITCAGSAEEAWRELGKTRFDLVLLDITLPKRDGYSLLSEMQAEPELQGIPVICLTGKKAVTDKVTAFSLGADDYLEKPFDPLELRARVEGKLAKRERFRERQELLVVENLRINRSTHRVSLMEEGKEREADLTQTEFKLLCKLASHPDQVFTRDQLLVSAWGDDARVLDRVVDVHVCSMRKKLGKTGKKIEAVPGAGYRLRVTAEKRKKAA